MDKIRRAILRVLGPQLPLAVAVTLLLGLEGMARQAGVLGWLTALGLGALTWVLPGIERACQVAPIRVVALPGYEALTRPPPSSWARLGVGAVALVDAVLVWARLVPLAFAVTFLAGIAMASVAGLALRRMRGRVRERDQIRSAVRQYQPKFVVYTGRRNDASYQLQMWLPQLDRLQVPYLIVVRHPEAVETAARQTKAPVICCAAGPDLDSVMVDSLRAAFYVNTIAENSTFVLYRQLTHVYLGHGDSDKELSGHPAHAMFDKIFVAGPAAIERYSWARVEIPADKFVQVGRPQLERVARPEQPITAVESPRVLYAPTWRGYNTNTNLSSLPVAPVIIKGLLERGAVVTFRPHPFSWQGRVERAAVEEVNALLLADRNQSGRQHLLATENRALTVGETFDQSDAMITDIGSVLVDYFATDKPYGVILPAGVTMAQAGDKFPTTEAAYLATYDELRGAGAAEATRRLLEELLQRDPDADRRPKIAHYYLGDHPGDDQPFIEAATAILEQTPPTAP